MLLTIVFDKTITISHILSVISIIACALGGVITILQWKQNSRMKRAAYIHELVNEMRSNPDIKNTFLQFEYGESWYTEGFHKSEDLERQTDETLDFFSYICYLYDNKCIKKKEFIFFEYKIIRILENEGVQDYFYNLYHFSKKMGAEFEFSYLLDYGKKKGIFMQDFYDKATCNLEDSRFHHYLNF